MLSRAQDNNPSLNLRQVNNRILISCQAGCQTEAIMQSLGLQMSDLFINVDAIPKDVPPKIVKEYDYKDANGNLLFQVVRMAPKSFRQRHKKDGEWVWNMEGVKRVLYHMDALYRVQEETIYLVEGEKDADNLSSWGLIATTSPAALTTGSPSTPII